MITLQSPGEILFNIGPAAVHWYGVMIAAGFLIGLIVVLHAAKEQNIDQNRIFDLSALLMICGIIFARLYYVIFDWDYFSGHLNEIFMTWQGGLSIHGVIIGGFFAMMAYTRFNKLNFLQYTDLYAYGLIIGQVIGRWGNFFNTEAFGGPTNLPIRVFIPEYGYCHPTFLYESIWNLIVFIILFYIIRKHPRYKYGAVTCGYFVLYSAGRFFIEGLRLDNIYSFAGLHIAQFVSLILIIAGILGLIMLYFKR
ncbi:MAG: prolipoprotein diacylglyceryl transferase [Candidatus Melainabacteria bacterium GWF2_37_15]|nr:MAG: prolipoprotein diacylglyceryl transferase [Candidatus Melainabacteria bacterium GWF2_37_15]